LRWFENLIHTVRSAPEIGTGTCSVVDAPLPRSVLAHRFDAPVGSILLLHNLADTAVTVDIGPLPGIEGTPYDLFLDGPYPAPSKKLTGLTLNGFGYRWIRLSRSDQG
jgi:maltose alpha-D-glucosyltransferase / alpha-amylase